MQHNSIRLRCSARRKVLMANIFSYAAGGELLRGSVFSTKDRDSFLGNEYLESDWFDEWSLFRRVRNHPPSSQSLDFLPALFAL